MDDVDFTGLEEVFRERVFDFLIQACKITQEVAQGLRERPHSGFQASFERKIERDDRKSLEGLIQYEARARIRAFFSSPSARRSACRARSYSSRASRRARRRVFHFPSRESATSRLSGSTCM